MESQDVVTQEKAEDEISLIDLFAVLLRYRKLIVIGTLLVAVCAGLYLFVLPLLFPQFSKQEMSVVYNVEVVTLPPLIQEKLAADNKSIVSVKDLAAENLTNLSFFATEYKKSPIFEGDIEKMDSYEYNKFISNVLSDKKFNVITKVQGGRLEIQILIDKKMIEKADAFVESLVDVVNAKLEDLYIPQITRIQRNFASVLAKITESDGALMDMSALVELQESLVEIEEFLSEFSGFIALDGEPFIIPEARGRAMKFIIVCFAAFFVMVFTAFLLNAINNIKKDPVASKVISDSWKAGK